MSGFVLDERLAAGHFVTDWPLCRIQFENDARFPWLVLVPRKPNLREIFDLEETERVQLIDEVTYASARLAETLTPTKMNVAMLGNVVPQLHAHVIARFDTDEAWPKPVWGMGTPKPYTPAQAAEWTARFKGILGDAP